MNIRKLTAEDATAYRELRLEALLDSPDAFGATYEDALNRPVEKTAERLADEYTPTFGAFEDGALVGNMTLIRNPSKKMNHRGSIVAVYVKASVRGKGVANFILEALLEYARNWGGLEQVYLMVVSDNEPAIKLYRRFGFEKYGTEYRSMKVDGRYIDEDLMVKFL